MRIVCDGAPGGKAHCGATARLPVALRPLLPQGRAGRDGGRRTVSVEGWLFCDGGEGWQHYCPSCAPEHLERFLSEGTP
jgi:hypothetical protein